MESAVVELDEPEARIGCQSLAAPAVILSLSGMEVRIKPCA